CGCRRDRISPRSTSVKRDPSGAGGSVLGARDAPRPPSPEPRVPGSRRGRMLAESAAVEEMPVCLEVSAEPAVTWLCTPDQLEELASGWLHGGGRSNETGGSHAAAVTDGERLLFHAEDIGRHNAVDKVIGAAVIARQHPTGRGLLVTGRISAELSYKAARAGVAYVATPSVPSTLALTIARRAGVVLVGRAVSGTPHVHRPEA